jgi:hypothetical protein
MKFKKKHGEFEQGCVLIESYTETDSLSPILPSCRQPLLPACVFVTRDTVRHPRPFFVRKICSWTEVPLYTHTHTHTHIYIYIWVCLSLSLLSYWFPAKDCFIPYLFSSSFLGNGVPETVVSHLQCCNTSHSHDRFPHRRLYPGGHCSARSKCSDRWSTLYTHTENGMLYLA